MITTRLFLLAGMALKFLTDLLSASLIVLEESVYTGDFCAFWTEEALKSCEFNNAECG
jgi:hypothetical protein